MDISLVEWLKEVPSQQGRSQVLISPIEAQDKQLVDDEEVNLKERMSKDKGTRFPRRNCASQRKISNTASEELVMRTS